MGKRRDSPKSIQPMIGLMITGTIDLQTGLRRPLRMLASKPLVAKSPSCMRDMARNGNTASALSTRRAKDIPANIVMAVL
jgi:hypothetical protein